MSSDPQTESLLARLCEDQEDPLHVLWVHISDSYGDGDCCKALRLLVATLGAQQQGRIARQDRKYDSCPFPEFEDAPIKPSDYLRLAWMRGYEMQDTEKRKTQAEGKVYDAYKSLTDIREYVDDFGGGQREYSQGTITLFAKRIRNLHGTILTSAVRKRINDEVIAQRALIGLEDEVKP